jgi:predicted CDP-diglyceride synthetase/phosphatidate cytidylyltransferase
MSNFIAEVASETLSQLIAALISRPSTRRPYKTRRVFAGFVLSAAFFAITAFVFASQMSAAFAFALFLIGLLTFVTDVFIDAFQRVRHDKAR